MDSNTSEIGSGYHRLWVSLAKATGLTIMLVSFYLTRLLYPGYEDIIAHWAMVFAVGSTIVVGLIDIYIEKVDFIHLYFELLSIAATLLICIDVTSFILGDYYLGIIPVWAFIFLFSMLHVCLAFHDREVEEVASIEYYPNYEDKRGFFLWHLCFNSIPYVLGFLLIEYIWDYPIVLLIILGVLCISLYAHSFFDEYTRRRWHKSIFWKHDF